MGQQAGGPDQFIAIGGVVLADIDPCLDRSKNEYRRKRKCDEGQQPQTQAESSRRDSGQLNHGILRERALQR